MKIKRNLLVRPLKILSVIILAASAISLLYFKANNAAAAETSPSAALRKTPAKGTSTDTFDVDVKISHKIMLDDKVQNVDPNIIEAAKQGIFAANYGRAKLSHYNYSVNNDIYIFEVDAKEENLWEVKFHVKAPDSDSYDKDTYCSVTVEKLKSGGFRGYMISPEPATRGDETY